MDVRGRSTYYAHIYRKVIKTNATFPVQLSPFVVAYFLCLLAESMSGPRPPPLRPLLSTSNLDLHGEADKVYKTSKPASRPFAQIGGSRCLGLQRRQIAWSQTVMPLT